MTLTQKNSGNRSIDKGSSRISKNTAGKKKKESSLMTKKSTLFLATSIIESAHYTVTRLGREIEAANFKNTYARLKKLYEEIE